MKKLLFICLLFVFTITKGTDTLYISPIIDSTCIKKNTFLIEKNKELKDRNIVSSTFAGIGFVATITLIAIFTRP